MAEGKLEVAIPIFGALVAGLAAGVAGTGDQATVGDEVTGGRKAGNVVDLEREGEGDDLANAGDPDQSLHIGGGNELRLKLVLDALDLLREKRELLSEHGRPHLHQRWQRTECRHVVLS